MYFFFYFFFFLIYFYFSPTVKQMVINNPESSEDLSEFDKESNGINITKLNVSVLEKTR